MTKELPVIWSPLAKDNFLNIIRHILHKWSLKDARKFDDKVKKLINSIKIQHNLCAKAKKSNLRKCIITSQTSLIYKVNKTSIELVNFIDNRSKPKY